jgi:hypothetical protein
VPRKFIRREMFSVKIDPERWLLLIKKGFHDWNLRVLGPEPLEVELLKLTDHEAQSEALTLAREHFRAVNPRVRIPRFQRWRLALSSEQGYPDAVQSF